MKSVKIYIGLAVFASFLSTANLVFSQDWSNWRGPAFNGNAPKLADNEKYPTKWNENEKSGILWKTEIPAWGDSTPIIVKDSIFLTTQINEEELHALRIDKNNGKIIWNKKLGAETTPRMQEGREFRGWQKMNNYHNLASPSVVADENTVIALFGNGSMYALDWDGNVKWELNIQKKFGDFMIWWGFANSPQLYKNVVIVPVMQDDLRDLEGKTPVDSYVVAFDKNTGKEVWRVIRNTFSADEYNDAYTTPVFWKHEGRTELLVLGGETLDAYNPETGERYWWVNHGLEGNRIVPSPVPNEELGLIIAVRGKREPVCCIEPKGLGQQPESAIIWSHAKNPPDVSCPVFCNGLLFFTDDGGVATCVDPKFGKVHWTHRLPGGTYFPSLFTADGNIYYMNNEGECTVVKADTK
ncbi:MAG: PQQ-binding-like beta-propeller repeat protein, partial [Thermoguttaceae bacterium]